MNVMHHEKGKDAFYKIWNASDENMIIYFCSDGGSLVFGDTIYPIKEGGLCFVSAGVLHYTMPSDPSIYDRCKIFLSPERTRALLASVSPECDFYRLFTENAAVYAQMPPKLFDTVEKLFANAKKGFEEKKEAVVCAAFFYLLSLIGENATLYTVTPDNFMARTVEYINSSYAEEVSLSALCRACGMSKSHFCRKFKAIMGITVMEYVLKTRIAAAKSLLLSSDLSIGQISEKCGFSSISYFCQKFKEEQGVSASAYRSKEKKTERE